MPTHHPQPLAVAASVSKLPYSAVFQSFLFSSSKPPTRSSPTHPHQPLAAALVSNLPCSAAFQASLFGRFKPPTRSRLRKQRKNRGKQRKNQRRTKKRWKNRKVMVLMRAKTSVSFNKTVDSVAIGNAWEGPYQRWVRFDRACRCYRRRRFK
ncbi:hypothetical protein COCNU_01G013570 [Cocos nucifera]|uniref:Uncharacterized protein n=1 Tax=Cocos nucifera TaxID=13894 RepID=A0A8K0HWE2_COCNU|nr:hypothetical protein COCNU_01G013570 [Cocos nucifera]